MIHYFIVASDALGIGAASFASEAIAERAKIELHPKVWTKKQ